MRIEVGPPNFSDPTIVRNDDDEFVVVVDMRPHCMFWAQFHFYDEDFSTPLGTGVFGFGHHIDAMLQPNVGRQSDGAAITHVNHAARSVVRQDGETVRFVFLRAWTPVAQGDKE